VTKAAQMRVSALLKGAWGSRARITLQPDGGLVADISCHDGRIVIVVDDESSPLLRVVGRVYLDAA
jgi:hypothetical protein